MRRCAVVTMVHDEEFFLPIWLDYFTRFFDERDLYLVDHDTTDGSVETARERYPDLTVFPVRGDGVYVEPWLSRQKWAHIAKVLPEYQYVLYLDADEFAVPDPEVYENVRDYVDRCEAPFVKLDGYNVLTETYDKPVDLSRPILSQRRYWSPHPLYCKPVLTTRMLDWEVGEHNATEARDVASDPALKLVHLRRLDYDMCRKRDARATEEWKREQSDQLFEGGWFSYDLHCRRQRVPKRFRDLL